MDVLLSDHRDAASASTFFEQAMGSTEVTPIPVTMDKAKCYPPALLRDQPKASVPRGRLLLALSMGRPHLCKPCRQPGAEDHRQAVGRTSGLVVAMVGGRAGCGWQLGLAAGRTALSRWISGRSST